MKRLEAGCATFGFVSWPDGKCVGILAKSGFDDTKKTDDNVWRSGSDLLILKTVEKRDS